MMRHPDHLKLFRYWNTLRGHNKAPLRNLVEPAALGTLLPSVLILSTEDNKVTNRLVGSVVCAYFNRDFRNESFGDFWLEGVKRKPNTLAIECAEQQKPLWIKADGLTNLKKTISMSLLLLPLERSEDRKDRVIGALIVEDQYNWALKEYLTGMSMTHYETIDAPQIHALDENDLSLIKSVSPQLRDITPNTLLNARLGGKRVHNLVVLDGGKS